MKLDLDQDPHLRSSCIRSEKNCWIRIRKKLMRIHSPCIFLLSLQGNGSVFYIKSSVRWTGSKCAFFSGPATEPRNTWTVSQATLMNLPALFTPGTIPRSVTAD